MGSWDWAVRLAARRELALAGDGGFPRHDWCPESGTGPAGRKMELELCAAGGSGCCQDYGRGSKGGMRGLCWHQRMVCDFSRGLASPAAARDARKWKSDLEPVLHRSSTRDQGPCPVLPAGHPRKIGPCRPAAAACESLCTRRRLSRL